MEYRFETEMEVRDYECDIQGIVNNANYLHYTEHTRHRWLEGEGISFSDLHERGIDVVVARMQLQYKTPLRPGDIMRSCLNVKKEGLRFVFNQDIYRKSDNQLCHRAQIEIVSLINGRLGQCDELDRLILKD